MILLAAVPLLSECQSTDGSTADSPRVESLHDRQAAMLSGGSQMLYGYRVGTGSSGASRGWVANLDAMMNPWQW